MLEHRRPIEHRFPRLEFGPRYVSANNAEIKIGRLPRQPPQRPLASFHETRLLNQIPRRIPRDRKLRENHHLRPPPGRFARADSHAFDVPPKVANRWIDLR